MSTSPTAAPGNSTYVHVLPYTLETHKERQTMKIIKRNGSEVPFDVTKIANAIAAANREVPEGNRLTERQVMYASANVADAQRDRKSVV